MDNDALPQSLRDFFSLQRARYAELFWYEVRSNKIVLMLEKLAEQARAIVKENNIQGVEIASFEADDSVGDFYVVDAEYIDVETRPSKEEYRSIMDRDLASAFTDQTNDIYKDQLVRVYQPHGYGSRCVVAYHSFGLAAPRGPIGWLRTLDGLRRADAMHFAQPERLISFKEACAKYEGLPYRIGAASPEHGFDCSGLVQRIVWETKGIWLPRKAMWQASVCEKISPDDARQGNLVFFRKKGDDHIDHVAFVFEQQIGKLPVIFHAKKDLGKVAREDLNAADWLSDYDIVSYGRIAESLLFHK